MFGIFPLEVELGILAGLAVAVSGYLQAFSKSDSSGKREKFSIDKFTTTVLIGVLAGGLISFVNLNGSAVTIFLSSAGIVAIVDSLVKVFLRSTKK